MSLEKISNLFNILCQAHPDLKYYHRGWESDINITVANNFTLGSGDETNPRGKKYPSLLFDTVSERWKLSKGGAESKMRGLLRFNDTQYYNSEDGSNNSRSILEAQQDLQEIALDIVSEFNRLGRAFGGKEVLIISNVNNVFYNAEARADRLVEVTLDIEIYYFLKCSNFQADIPALDPPFNVLPPTDGDYELLKPI